jgi:hypothetical protein
MIAKKESRRFGAVLYEDFELLDLYGPLEMFGCLGPEMEIVTVAEYEWHTDADQDPFVKFLNQADVSQLIAASQQSYD